MIPSRVLAAVVLVLCSARPAGAQRPDPPPTSATPRLLEAVDRYTGVAGRVDDRRARSLLEEASRDPDDPLARMWLARVFSRGRMGFEQSEAQARRIAEAVIDTVRALAARDDVEASFLMGTAYAEALGVPQDEEEAARWYRRAGMRGHVLAAHNLGNAYRAGSGVERSDALAVTWWLRAAHAGDAITRLRLGEAFESGLGAAPDRDRALAWYELAAAQGNDAAAEAADRLRGR